MLPEKCTDQKSIAKSYHTQGTSIQTKKWKWLPTSQEPPFAVRILAPWATAIPLLPVVGFNLFLDCI